MYQNRCCIKLVVEVTCPLNVALVPLKAPVSVTAFVFEIVKALL